jgi:hypothetical protein
MSVSTEERTKPSREQLEELLGLLLAANEAGQLVSLVFMLEQPSGLAVVDYRGSYEKTELACRTTAGRIAVEIEKIHPNIAAAIRRDLNGAAH